MTERRAAPRRTAAPPPPSPRPSSLADVARLANVSAGTVSRVLSRPEMISDATRQRVLAAVERLGYVPNGAARALVARRTRTVGALVPRFGNSSFPSLVQALESTLAAGGYTLLLSAPEHVRADDPALLRTLLERGVDAVALLGAERMPQAVPLLTAHGVPFVMLWGAPDAGAPVASFDEHAAAALVIDHLADLGHRDIGFISGRTADNPRARRRFHGLLEAVARRGLVLGPQALVETDYGFREGYDAMRALLTRAPSISAVVCGNDYLAAGALSALDREGIAVPQRLSVASFNDSDFSAFLHPPLTTVHVPIEEMGQQAGRYLLARLEGQDVPWPEPLPARLVVRESTGPAAPAVASRQPSKSTSTRMKSPR